MILFIQFKISLLIRYMGGGRNAEKTKYYYGGKLLGVVLDTCCFFSVLWFEGIFDF